MRKLALAAVAALAATALTGAAAVPAASETQVHTKRFVSRHIRTHSLSTNTAAGAGVDRHAGHTIGYDTFTAHFYPKQDRSDIWVTFALKNGTIAGVVHSKGPGTTPGTVFHGRILNGTGKYKGVDGTVSVRPGGSTVAKKFITLTYHF
jgi:hypothetical protein